ncbi:peptide MFS transporter [Campylobacter jejuni]|nr:peptide MFS transporter [Campylobacter jejuni]
MMTFASQNLINNNGLPISMVWIIISIFFLTLGELCVSPVGLSIMAKVAPDLIKNQIMGLWFVASALGNALAGFIGGKASEENIAYLPNLFYQCMWILLGAVIILLILKKPINKILKN